MKICLIGGIYGKGGARSSYLRVTPETTLENGLRAAGHHVTTLSHYDETDFSPFDVVHVHHLSFGALRLAGDPSRTPFVFSPHCSVHIDGTESSRARRLAMRFILSVSDTVVGLTESEVAKTGEIYGIPATRLATIPNGIDDSNFTFRRGNSAGRNVPWRILFVGQLIPLKRCDLLLHAMATLPHSTELTLVYQNGQMAAEWKALAASLGLAHRVHFRGPATPPELAALYQQSDLFVLPSDTEALPSVLTEAMLCGLPFVASAVGGIPEQANGFGNLFRHRSAAALANAMAQVFDNYPDFLANAESMSGYARRTFAISSMVEQHLNLYQRLQGLRPRRHALRFAASRLLARAAAHRLGTAGPAVSQHASVTKVA